jgi:hypothetical protein
MLSIRRLDKSRHFQYTTHRTNDCIRVRRHSSAIRNACSCLHRVLALCYPISKNVSLTQHIHPRLPQCRDRSNHDTCHRIVNCVSMPTQSDVANHAMSVADLLLTRVQTRRQLRVPLLTCHYDYGYIGRINR